MSEGVRGGFNNNSNLVIHINVVIHTNLVILER